MNDLLAALAAAGIDDVPVFDGNIHRCKVAGKKGKPGWYVFHDLNGKIFGCFGDWSTGEKTEWHNGNGLASLTDREMEALRLAAEARRRERRRMAEQAAKEAAELLRDAEETEGHPYCLSKGIKGPVPVADGEIIVPLYDSENKLTGAQKIDAAGGKLFVSGSQKKGCFCPLPGDESTVYVCEGWATGKTINEATRCKVLVAFDAGNLLPVAEQAVRLYAKAEVITAADNDHSKEVNTGLNEARKVKERLRIDFVFPECSGTDFNDLAAEHGIDAVRKALARSSKTKAVSINKIMRTEYRKIRWAVEGIIPEGLTILAGRPKFGKSWLMLGLAYSIATGTKAWGYGATEKGSVYYLALEDSERRIKDRVLSMEGFFDTYPDDLYIITDFPRIGEGFAEEIQYMADRDKNISAIIIDTLQKIRPTSAGGKRNLYQAEYEDYEKLQRFAITDGIPIICVHHTRKQQLSGGTGNPVDEISGSTGIQGVADTLIVCKREGAKGMMHVTGREVNEESYPMEFNKRNMTWNLSAPVSEKLDVGFRQLLAYLAKHGEITAKELAEVCDVSYYKANRIINELTEQGKLVVVRTGEKNIKFYGSADLF